MQLFLLLVDYLELISQNRIFLFESLIVGKIKLEGIVALSVLLAGLRKRGSGD